MICKAFGWVIVAASFPGMQERLRWTVSQPGVALVPNDQFVMKLCPVKSSQTFETRIQILILVKVLDEEFLNEATHRF